VVVFTVISLIYGESRIVTTRVAPIPSAPAGIAAIPAGSQIVSVGDRPVTEFADIAEAIMKVPAGPAPFRLGTGTTVNVQIPESDEARAELWRALPPMIPTRLGQIERGSPAQRAGLLRGDQVVSINGNPVQQWQELVLAVRANPGRPVTLVVEREGGREAFTLTPDAAVDRDSAGRRITIGRAGVAPDEILERRRVGPIRALGSGLQQTWATAAGIGDILRKLVTGRMSTRNLGGIISIGEASGESARLGLEYFLGFLALFSVNLAVLNLLPIPILDGGHLVFLLAEALRGRPLSVETRVRLSQVGLIVVVALMLLANGNDVVRKVQHWFGG
jgi:regulator of sigma E protease